MRPLSSFGAIPLAAALLIVMTDVAGADALAPPGRSERSVVICGGAHYARVYTETDTAWGYTFEAVFPPGSVAQLTRALGDRGFGMALRYNKTFVENVGKFEGGEIGFRRYLDRGGSESRRLWWGAGFGQHIVRLDGESGGKSTWSLHLDAGIEWEPSERFLLQLELVNRSLEFSTDSFSASSLILTLGTRIDP